MIIRLQLMFVLTVSLAAWCPGDVDQDPAVDRAREACAELGGTLKSQLEEAVRSSNFIGAIEVCQAVAPVVAENVSRKHHLSIRRTSLKTRNPANLPHPRERRALKKMERRIKAGESPETVDVSVWIEGENGGKELFYMKPIMTKALCLTCHGKNLDPVLQQEIRIRYPGDQATGYELNQLRGAFAVRVPVAND